MIRPKPLPFLTDGDMLKCERCGHTITSGNWRGVIFVKPDKRVDTGIRTISGFRLCLGCLQKVMTRLFEPGTVENPGTNVETE